jgi:beta-galactosidase/beta-glucuronidase
MSDLTEPLHPTPQLARADWIDLCGPWAFAYDDGNVGLLQHWEDRDDVFDRTITVPFPPESVASGIGDTSYHPYVWYRRTVEIEPPPDGKRLTLHFGAVDYRAHVWVNGDLVASHEGGMTPFQADVTDALNPDGVQVIVVRAEDDPTDLTQPRGKQDWREKAHAIWYDRTTGIWQPVWMETVGMASIASLRWTPDLDRGTLGMHIKLDRRTTRPVEIRVQLSLRGMPIVDDTASVFGTELRRELALDLASITTSRDEVLWSPGHPNLLDAEITVLTDGEATDRVSSYAGLRSVGVQGGRFLLNGVPYFLRLALEQGYWPETHLAAPSADALRREVELTKGLGFNGVRIHQKVEDPRYLYWCDRLGLFAWGEMANAYVFSEQSVERLTREWMEVLQRDASHPCIIAWVPINESWGVPNLLHDRAQQSFVRSIYHLTKAIDPSRPVIANDGWEYITGDIFGIHDYIFDGKTIVERYGSREALERTLREVQPQYRFVTLTDEREPSVPFVLTEFGGISYRPAEDDRGWYGYGTVADAEAYLQKYWELVSAILSCPPLAGFCYTQLTDTMQETNGLLTADRKPKLDPEAIRSINTSASMGVPADIISQLRRRAGSPFDSTARARETGDEGEPEQTPSEA